MSGLPFWDDAATLDLEPESTDDDLPTTPYSLQSNTIDNRNKLAEQVIKKIELRKKHKVQLVSELDGIKDLFKGWQQRMRALHLHSDIMASANFLN